MCSAILGSARLLILYSGAQIAQIPDFLAPGQCPRDSAQDKLRLEPARKVSADIAVLGNVGVVKNDYIWMLYRAAQGGRVQARRSRKDNRISVRDGLLHHLYRVAFQGVEIRRGFHRAAQYPLNVFSAILMGLSPGRRFAVSIMNKRHFPRFLFTVGKHLGQQPGLLLLTGIEFQIDRDILLLEGDLLPSLAQHLFDLVLCAAPQGRIWYFLMCLP